MGHNSSRGNEQIDISINHPKFVQSRVLHELEKQILRTTVPCDQKTYKVWKQLLQKYKSINHEYLLLPLQHKYHSSGLCATRGQVQIEYNNYPYLLTEEIYHRKGKKVPFTQPQLWYLLYAYLSAKNHLKEHGEYPYNLIGDIRPQNIFVNQNGQVKFSNLLSWPGEKVNYRKTFDGITTYLSPQDYQLLQLGTMNNEKNEKSQFFSIGFTLVSAAVLKDNNDVYNIQKQKFDQYEAKKRINAFKCSTIYSELLRAIISSLCSFQIKRRIQFSDLWLWITKYERRIMTKQPFMIEEVPPKINEHINVLRTQILAIEPSTSVLNLNSIKSLKGSQAKNQILSVKKTSTGILAGQQIMDAKQKNIEIKKLKQVQKGSAINQETEKRKSRIVINFGVDQKVFYSPTNGAYFTSQVTEKSQISQLKSQVGNQGSKIQGFYSPPSKVRGVNINYDAHKLSKSPQGFYSPNGSNNQKFRVFIQYKSPSKPIDKPYAQTTYIGKEGQPQGVTFVESMEVIQTITKKQSDSKSQKSGDSNRQNRFIEQTKKQSPRKEEQIKISEIQQNKQVQTNIVKKGSPIHQIITSEQTINHGVSQVISQEVILPSTKVKVPSNNLKQLAEKNDEFQISFSIQQNLPTVQSAIVARQNVYSQKVQQIQQLNSKPHQINDDITSEYLENFHGLKQVRRQSKKKQSNHDSKIIQQQRSKEQDMKRIEDYLTKGDLLRLKQEQQINEQTFDDGRHVVIPTKQSIQSNSMKFQILQRHQNSPKVSRHHGQNIPPYDQIIADIYPIQKQSFKRQKTLSDVEIQKHRRMQEQIKKKMAQIEESEKQLIDQAVKQVVQLESTPEVQVQQISQFESAHQQVQKVQQQVKEQIGNETPIQSQPLFDSNLINILQLEVLQIGNQIVDLKNNFQIPDAPAVQMRNNQPQTPEQVVFDGHISTEEIIDNQISSEKQPSQFKPLQQSHHSEQKIEQNFVIVANSNNHANILIEDEDQGVELDHQEVKNEQAVNLQSENLHEYEHGAIVEERPLIPLGPEKHHQQIIQQVQVIQNLQQINKIQDIQQVQANVEQVISQQVIIVQQKQVVLPQKVSQVIQQAVSETIKKPQSPFQQIEQQPHQLSQFHSSSIQSIVPLEQKIIHFEQQSSQNKSENQLQSANIVKQEQVQILQNEHRQVVQQITDVSVNDNNTITNYETVEYHHQISLGGSGSGDKIVYNVIQVNENSLPLDNGVNNDSLINGEGKVHSRVFNESAQIVQLQNSNPVLPQQIIIGEQQYFAVKPQNAKVTIQQVNQKVVVQPIQIVQEKILNHSHHITHQSFDDAFLKDIQQTNQKLHQIQQTQKHTHEQPLIVNQNIHVVEANISKDKQFLQQIEEANKKLQQVEDKPEQIVIKHNLHSLPNTLLDDQFLRDVQQTNNKLNEIHQIEQKQKRASQPFVLHDLQKMDEPQVQTQVHVILESGQQQSHTYVQQIQNIVQKYENGVQKIVNEIEIVNTSKDHSGSQIKNSQIQFDVVKQVIGASKQLNKYEVVYEQPQIIDEAKSQGKQILPVESNPNQQQVEKQQIQTIEIKNESNQILGEVKQLQSSVVPPKTEVNNNEIKSHYIPNDGNYLHFTNLQLTLQGAPTESEFGNISEIMDINKDFNNTLNVKQRNFLQGTSDPRNDDFFRELINLSQNGKIQETDLQKVNMSKEDRDRLTNFMRKWQNLNPQEEQNMQQYIEEFRQVITRSQIQNPNQQNSNEHAKIRMSAQDQQTLRLVVEKLNGRNPQLQVNPSDRRYPVNYDQSYVNVECSDMKTDIVVLEREVQKKEIHQQNQQVIPSEAVNIFVQNVQNIARDVEENENKQTNGQVKDIITEIIQINQNLNNSNKNQVENQQIVLESTPVPRQGSDNFSTEVNAPTTFQSSTLPEVITHVIEQHSDQGQQTNNSVFGGILNEIKSVAANLREVIEEAIDNSDNKQIRGSQVDASVGQKSQRQDPLTSQIYQDKGSQSANIQNLHILKNHRTYSEPNNFLERGSISGDTSQTIKQEIISQHTTIVQQLHEHEEHVPEQVIIEKRSSVKHQKDLIDQITEINEVIKTSVHEIVAQQPTAVVQKVQQAPINVDTMNTSGRSSQRRSNKPRDFLDQVMMVNKVLNNEQHKDYEKDNKYLNVEQR